MELLNLRNHSLKYKSHQDIERALVWNAIKKFLDEKEKSKLFSYISDIVISEKNISIYVKKPIVKSEFVLFGEDFENKILNSLTENYHSHERKIKIL